MSDSTDLIVGRDQELALLRGLLDQVVAGNARFVFLSGEPGIGKTRLLDELASTAEDRAFLTLRGRAAEFEEGVAFGPLIDALDHHLQSLSSLAFDRLAADNPVELSAVFPALRSLQRAGSEPTGAGGRVRIYHAIRELIERLAATQPLLLALDDLQWADRGSLELIAHLLRRPLTAPVLVAGAMRTGRRSLLSAAIDASGAERLELGPLSANQAAALLADWVRGEERTLFEASGGNPFYLRQLARERPSQRRDRGGGAKGEVPAAVQAAISDELDALPQGARAFAEGAAVAGDPFDLDLAIAAAGLDEAEVPSLLDQLVDQELVRETGVPRQFAFRHPLVRAAVYQAASPGRRLQAHARSARLLRVRMAPPQVLAHHVEHAARPGDGDAIRVLTDAAAWAATHAPASAVRWRQSALRLLPAEASAERVALLTLLSSSLVSLGELSEAHAAAVEALEAADDADRTRLTIACSGLEHLLGRHEAARERLGTALAAIPEEGSADGVALLVELAMNAFYRVRFDEMAEMAERGVEIARSRRDAEAIGKSLAVAAMAAAFVADVPKAERFRQEAAALVDAMDDQQLAEALPAIVYLAAAELYLDRYDSALEHSSRAVRLARERGEAPMYPTLLPTLGTSLWLFGRLHEAKDLFADGVETARLNEDEQALSWLLLNQAFALLHLGETKAALAATEESVAIAERLGDSVVAAWATAMRGDSLVESGEPRRGLEVLVSRGEGDDDLSHMPGGWRIYFADAVVRALVGTGEVERAGELSHRLLIDAEAIGLPLPRALAHRSVALTTLQLREPETAASHAADSVELAESMGSPLEAARSRVPLGRALAAAGRREEAAAALVQAVEQFGDFDAVRYRDQAEQELRKLGHRIHRRSRPATAAEGLESLSGRELEVAGLVADHRSNKEIAAALFLSLKTVETHLRNIFRKLDVDSRAEVARAVLGTDLRTP